MLTLSFHALLFFHLGQNGDAPAEHELQTSNLTSWVLSSAQGLRSSWLLCLRVVLIVGSAKLPLRGRRKPNKWVVGPCTCHELNN